MGKSRGAGGGGSAPEGPRDLPPCSGENAAPNAPAIASWIGPSRGAAGGGYRAASDPDMQRDLPSLFDFLSLTGLAGKQRHPGTLLIFAEDGKWKGCLTDKDGGYYAFVSGDSLQGLLGALERGLCKEGLDWRVSKWKKS